MDAATACLAPRIKTMLPRWEATTIACHCVGRRFTPFANSLTVIANVPPAHIQIMSEALPVHWRCWSAVLWQCCSSLLAPCRLRPSACSTFGSLCLNVQSMDETQSALPKTNAEHPSISLHPPEPHIFMAHRSFAEVAHASSCYRSEPPAVMRT
jgi:hypothetical protein